MSRISYADQHRDVLQKMHEAIIEALDELTARASKTAKIRRRNIYEAAFVGNTTMTISFWVSIRQKSVELLSPWPHEIAWTSRLGT